MLVIKAIRKLKKLGLQVVSVGKDSITITIANKSTHFIIEREPNLSKWKLVCSGQVIVYGQLEEIVELFSGIPEMVKKSYLTRQKGRTETSIFPKGRTGQKTVGIRRIDLSDIQVARKSECRYLSLIEKTNIVNCFIKRNEVSPVKYLIVDSISPTRIEKLKFIVENLNGSVYKFLGDNDSQSKYKIIYIVYLGDDSDDSGTLLISVIKTINFDSLEQMRVSLSLIDDIIDLNKLNFESEDKDESEEKEEKKDKSEATIIFWFYPKDPNINLTDFATILEISDCIVSKAKC